MRVRKFKLQSPGAFQAAAQASESARPSRATVESSLSPTVGVGAISSPLDLVLGLQKLLGGVLSIIGVSMQVANILICVSLLLLGPAVIFGLLPT